MEPPKNGERIAALEAALHNEAARFRRGQVVAARTPSIFHGDVTESVDDFFTDFERYIINNQIAEVDLRNHLPNFLANTAREFFER